MSREVVANYIKFHHTFVNNNVQFNYNFLKLTKLADYINYPRV